MKSLQNPVNIWMHTSVISPYRVHLVRNIAERYPALRVFETVSLNHIWFKDRAWQVLDHALKKHVISLKAIELPRDQIFDPAYFWHLARQPRGTLHIVGSVGLNWILIMFFCLLRHSYYVLWNDGGFPNRLPQKKETWFSRFRKRHISAAFTPGECGEKYSIKQGVASNRIYNSFFSHDMEQYKQFYQEQANMERLRIRTERGISQEAIVVLTVSRYLDWKRLTDAANALKLLDDRYEKREIHYLLIGQGDDHSHQPILQTLKNIKVHYIQKVDPNEILSWYVVSDILLFPSEGDIWGLVTNEALSLGVPVICTRVIGSSELVKDGVNGFKVDVRNPEQIAERLEELISNPVLLLNMKRNAISIWQTWYSDLAVMELTRMIADLSSS